MKKEKAVGMLGVIILIAFIVASGILIYKNVRTQISKSKEGNIESNMLLIQGACKKLSNKASVSKDVKLIGTKLLDFTGSEENASKKENKVEEEDASKDESASKEGSTSKDESNAKNENTSEEKTDENIDKEIIKEFLSKEIIKENYDKFYVLTDKDLESLQIKVVNEKDAYYIVNYESNEVYITKEFDGKYKL